MPATEIVSILKILELLQSWPVWIVAIILLLSPWIAVIYLSRAADRRAETERKAADDRAELERKEAADRADKAEKAAADRAAAHDLKSADNLLALTKIADAGWKAYADNGELVRETQAIAKQAVALAEQAFEVISLNTQQQTTAIQMIKTNMFCPLARKGAGAD